jgi:hypothetical protein
MELNWGFDVVFAEIYFSLRRVPFIFSAVLVFVVIFYFPADFQESGVSTSMTSRIPIACIVSG